jgi:hypothetical protein
MKSAILPFLLCVLLAPALAVAADGAGEGVTRRSLDLSLPRDALSETWSPPPAGIGSATSLPDLGGGHSNPAQRGGGNRGDLPYGTGYEARQSGGGGHGRGGGRGR